MKRIALFILSVSLIGWCVPAHATEMTAQPWPKNCGSLLHRCRGWEVTVPGFDPQGRADLHHFVSKKKASNAGEAIAVAKKEIANAQKPKE